MKTPPTLPNESERLAALEATRLVYSPAEERFDRLTRLAAGVFGAPVALVSLVDDRRQYFKSAFGLETGETPREIAFCAHAIADGDRLVVEDALADERFADNPLVTGEPHVRAYAGRVIRSPSGQPVGTLCVIDQQARKFTDEQIALLGDLATIAQTELGRDAQGVQFELLRETGTEEREAKLDADTRCWNHEAMVELLLRQAQAADKDGKAFALGLVHVERLDKAMRHVGEDDRRLTLRAVAGAIKRVLGESDALGRFDADSFIVLLPGADRTAAASSGERVRKAIASQSFLAGRISVWLDATLALAIRNPGAALADVLQSATLLLEEARRAGRHVALVD
jgi:diguanylate cyclase (GGDEF)-like protein